MGRVGVGAPGVVWIWHLLLELCFGTFWKFLFGIKLTYRTCETPLGGKPVASDLGEFR